MLSTTYKAVFNILLSKLTPYVDEIIGAISADFIAVLNCSPDIVHSSDTTEKWEYSGIVYQLFISFKNLRLRREVVFNTLIESGMWWNWLE
jgi:hypothetical protein